MSEDYNSQTLSVKNYKASFERQKYFFDVANNILVFICLISIVLAEYFLAYSAAIFLTSGILLIAINFRSVLYNTIRNMWLLILPLYCLISVYWSDFPQVSLRNSTQLIATVVIAISLAVVINPNKLLDSLFWMFLFGLVLSLTIGHNPSYAAWNGIFGSKNSFANHIATLIIIAGCMLVAQKNKPIFNFLYFVTIIISLPIFFKAQSGGALMALLLSIISGSVLLLATRFSRVTMFLFIAFCFISLIGGGLFYMLNSENISYFILTELGKDTTLTGRTDLWKYGIELIKEKPLLGAGYHAFWVQGNSNAETLWQMFGIKSRMGFHFHNMYISNAVEIGIVGVLMQIVILTGGVFIAVKNYLVTKSAIWLLFAILTIRTLVFSFFEVPLYSEFSFYTIMFTLILAINTKQYKFIL